MSSGPRAAGVATRARFLVRGLVVGLAAMLAMPAAAAAIDEYPVGANPGGITAGPDGALWFVEERIGEPTPAVARITTAGAVTSRFPIPSAGTTLPPTDPNYVNALDQITAGPDGALWFTQPRDNQIGRITTAGDLTEYTLSVPGARPDAITLGPDNNLWFTAPGAAAIGRITPGGSIELFQGAAAGAQDITAGPDGTLWFTASLGNSIGRISTSGTILGNFPVPTPGAEPAGITVGPGGGLWFTESAVGQIAQISTSGTVTEYPGAGAAPSAITGGADGALWFTQSLGNAIGRSTTGGAITNHFAVPTLGSEPSDITAGPDGALWFTEFAANKIGRIATAAPVVVAPPTVKPLLRKRCKVPKLKGLTVKKAKKKLKRAKCRYKVRGRGRVTKTSPKAGKRTRKVVKVTAKPKRRRQR
jgi:virginiamycin B lyase